VSHYFSWAQNDKQHFLFAFTFSVKTKIRRRLFAGQNFKATFKEL